LADRTMVQAADRGQEAGGVHAPSGCPELETRDDRAWRAGRADVFQAALSVEPVELLHLLLDRQVRRLDPGGAALSIPVSRFRRGRRLLRRAAGGWLRPQRRDLVFDPGRAAVVAAAAACRSCRERGTPRVDRPD